MIDTLFQEGTDKAIADRLQRPQPYSPPPAGTFAGFWRAPGGAVAGVLEAAGARMDEAFGAGQVLAAGGTDSGQGMFSTQTDAERAQSKAAHDKLMRQGVDMSSAEGDALRVKAKDFMPDPQTTGAATQVLAGVMDFVPQAVAATSAGPGGLINLGVDQALTEADRLRLQGVDEATRTKAGAAAGLAAAGSMLLPMSGATRLARFGKGAAGGEAALMGQAEAERLILEHAGYQQLADQYDPLDPTTLALGLVPGVLGAALGHPVKTDAQMRGAAAFTPAEQAHAAAFEASAGNLRELKAAIDAEKNPENKAALQAEFEKQSAAHAALGAARDPAVVDAARVNQTAAAIDASRLTRDDNLAGHDQHAAAVETAADQLARGEPVDVGSVFGDALLGGMRESRVIDDHVQALEDQRAQLLAEAGNQLEPGAARALHQQIAELESQAPDDSAAAAKARAKELQGENVSYKQALGQARQELAARVADHQASLERLQQQLETHARAAQATERISGVEHDLAAAQQRAAELPGPRTSPRRLALAMADAFAEMRAARAPEEVRAPVTQPDHAAFHEAKTAAEAGTPEGKPAAPPVPPPKAAEGAGTSAPALDTSAVEAAHPDMLVHLDGMDAPMRVEDLMAAVREEAAQTGRDSRLLEVAAACALRS